jgi:putative transposase
MAEENAGWGAPKIHGELQKLGFELSERTVARYLRRIRRRGNSGQRWLTFLKNHREVIVAFDLFTVPTLTFQLLYCFFVIEHGRRRILHLNVTRHPTADWAVQQLREAFPDAVPYRYAILDHDSKFDADVMAFLKATGLTPKRTSVQAPWQNGLAERWVGSCRREILDHVIALNEQHLRRRRSTGPRSPWEKGGRWRSGHHSLFFPTVFPPSAAVWPGELHGTAQHGKRSAPLLKLFVRIKRFWLRTARCEAA